MTLEELPPTISIEHAGQILGISRRSAYRAAARGELPTFKVGRRLLVPTSRLLILVGVPDAAVGTGSEPRPDPPLAGAVTKAAAKKGEPHERQRVQAVYQVWRNREAAPLRKV